MKQLSKRRPWWQRWGTDLFDTPAYKDPLAYWAGIQVAIVTGAFLSGYGGFIGYLGMLFSAWLLFVLPLAAIREWWRDRKATGAS